MAQDPAAPDASAADAQVEVFAANTLPGSGAGSGAAPGASSLYIVLWTVQTGRGRISRRKISHRG